MKSFIFAWIMLLSVAVFTVINAFQTLSHIDEILLITEALPKNEEDFEKRSQEIEDSVYELTQLWEKYFPLISFTAGYENTNRCDEAIGTLEIHFKNGNGEDFSVSLAELRDSLARLKILEGFHWHGIF